jgi:hypothetical protein
MEDNIGSFTHLIFDQAAETIFILGYDEEDTRKAAGHDTKSWSES